MKKFEPIMSGMPHMLHGGDYNPEQWLNLKDTVWKEDMRIARLAGINTLSVGIFSWSILEPEDGVYDFRFLDEVMDMLAENGMKAVLATPSGARPPWLAQKYPEVLRVNADRSQNRFGGRHNHCLTSPIYRKKVADINEALAARYQNHPALGMWHLSNEYGGQCHCQLCQEKFREFLKVRYGTLERLNEAWWTTFWAHRFSDWSQIESPGPNGEEDLPGLYVDWMRFNTRQFADFIRVEQEPLKRITPHVPTTINMMRLYTELDYGCLSKEVDIASWDNYPTLRMNGDDWEAFCENGFNHDWFRAMKRRPFMMMESSPSSTNWQGTAKLRRPGLTHLYGMQAIAHGSDSVQYFQFRKGRGSSEQHHGAVVDHVGHENTRVFREVAYTGSVLSQLDDVVGTMPQVKTALIFDVENRWALTSAQYFNNEIPDKGYVQTLQQHYRALKQLGIDVDIVESTADLSQYNLVIAPMLYMLREGTAEKLDQFVRNGGKLVLDYIAGYVNESTLCYRFGFPGELMETVGLWNEEIDALYPEDCNQFTWKGKTYRADQYCALVHPKGARVEAVYEADFYAGMPALCCNELELGEAWFLAAHTGNDFLVDFYRELAQNSGISVEENLPHGVYLCRRYGEDSCYRFYLNGNGSPVELEIPVCGENALTGEKIEGKYTLKSYECLVVKA